MIFLEKLRESAISVLPIMALVSLLHLAVAPLGALFPPFLLGGVLIIIGLSFFLVGADIGVLPMGQRAGSALVHKRNLPCCWAQASSSVSSSPWRNPTYRYWPPRSWTWLLPFPQGIWCS